MESLSDIETELRTLSQSSKYCELQPTVSGKPISFYFAEIADRIKAAAPTTEKSSAVGNAAMREALVQCELFLGNVSRHGHPTLCLGDQCTACNGVDELRGMVVRALSTPARNCDKYANLHDAWLAWQNDCAKDMQQQMKFHVWLYATEGRRDRWKVTGRACASDRSRH